MNKTLLALSSLFVCCTMHSSVSSKQDAQSPRTLAALVSEKASDEQILLQAGFSAQQVERLQSSSNPYTFIEACIENIEGRIKQDLRAQLGRTPTPQEVAEASDAEFDRQRNLLIAQETQPNNEEAQLCQQLIAAVRSRVNRTPTEDELNAEHHEWENRAREQVRARLNRTPNELEIYQELLASHK